MFMDDSLGSKSICAVNKGLRGTLEEVIAQENWSETSKVQNLTLASNKITSLDGFAENFEQIEQANFSGNVISRLNVLQFAGLQHLVYLDLACNCLEEIGPGTFAPLPSLIKLGLAYNSIKRIQGLSVLSGLKHLDLRENCIAVVAALKPLLHCTSLETLQLQSVDGTQANRVCASPSYASGISKLIPTLKQLDGSDLALLLENESLQMPHFDEALERFEKRTKETKADGNIKSKSVTESSSNPWNNSNDRVSPVRSTKAPGRRKIVHSKIVKQASLNNKQKRCIDRVLTRLQVEEGFHKLIQTPMFVLDMMGLNPDENVYIDENHFQFMVNAVGVNFNDEDVQELIKLRDPFLDGLCLDNYLEVVRNASRFVSIPPPPAPPSPPVAQVDSKMQVVEQVSPPPREPVQRKAKTVDKGIQDDSLAVIGTSLTRRAPVENVDTQTDGAMVEENNDGHADIVDMLHCVNELNKLKQRLEESPMDVSGSHLKFLEDQLEKTIQFSRNEVLKLAQKYDEKVETMQTVRESDTLKSMNVLQSEKDALNAKLTEQQTIEGKLRKIISKAEQQISVMEEKIASLQDSNQELMERLQTHRESAEMAQSHLASQVSMIASKLAASESMNAESKSQAQGRAQEAEALNERLGKVLEEQRFLAEELAKCKSELAERNKAYHDLAETSSSRIQELSDHLAKMKYQLAFVTKTLETETEKNTSLTTKHDKAKSEIQHLVKLIRDQKKKLELSVETIHEKELAAIELKNEIVQLKTTSAEELQEIKNELQTAKQQVHELQERKHLSDDVERTALDDELKSLTMKYQTEILHLKTKAGDLEVALGVKSAMLDDHLDTISKLETNLKQMSHRERTSHGKIEELEDKLARTNDKLVNAQKTAEQQQQIIDSYEDTVGDMGLAEEVKQELEEAYDVIQQKDKALSVIEEEMSKLVASFRKHEEDLLLKTNHIKQLENQLTFAQSELEKSRLSAKDTSARYDQVHGELQRFQDMHNRSESTIRNQTSRIEDLEHQVQAKIRELGSLREQFAEKEKAVTERTTEVKVLARALEVERKKTFRNMHKMERLMLEMKGD